MRDDNTAADIPLRRSRQGRRTGKPKVSRGDPALIEAMDGHLRRCFPGWDGPVLHEHYSPLVHLDVMVVRPTADHPCLRLVTCGMAEMPMHVPPDWSDTPYVELSIALPPNWPLSMHALRDERYSWPVRLMKQLAREPHECETFLWIGNTFHGNPSQPYGPDTRLCASLIAPPMTAPAAFGEFTVGDGRLVRIFGVLPLYVQELDVTFDHSSRALLDMLADADVDDVVGPRRRNVARAPREAAGGRSRG